MSSSSNNNNNNNNNKRPFSFAAIKDKDSANKVSK